MSKVEKNIEDIMYEMRTLRSLVFFTFFLNAFAYLLMYGYFILAK